MAMAQVIWQRRLIEWEYAMNKILYMECFSGISGDMSVAALLDLGANKDKLIAGLESIPLDGYRIEISRVEKSGIDCMDFNVILDDIYEGHDHDMEFLHGTHNHGNKTHNHDIHHIHRGINEIVQLIQKTQITQDAKALSIKIFEILADAEAKAHGIPRDQVHFHEVGAVDSIVDIVAFAICFDDLQIQEVIISELYEGMGFVRAQHGNLPVPVPAVLNIVEQYGIHLHRTQIEGEFVTPTGAAIVAAIRTKTVLPDRYQILKSGMGAGKRKYERPSILRAMLIEESESELYIYKLETDIDDCSGEALGYVIGKLYENGAKEVHFIPIFMKKNRPAYELVVLCEKNKIETMEQIIFSHTTTIGIRNTKMQRTVLERDIVQISTILGDAMVKICKWNDKVRCYPEYESVIKLCNQNNMSFQQVYKIIQEGYSNDL